MSSRKDKYALSPSPLGIGGQAEVFEARDKRTNAIVALKRVRRGEEDFVARLRREIQVQMALNHPNIMPVLDHSTSYYWYTMPMADKVLGKLPTPINNQTLIHIVQDCANGLAAAHEKGFVHRDLTPNNIMQLRENNVARWVVSDWGLVRRHGQTTIVRTFPGQSFGTDGFAAPEMYDDAHTADCRADVYSLGRVVAWALTGRWPIPNVPLVPEGPWQEFASATTKLDIALRVQDMNGLLHLLDKVKGTLASRINKPSSDAVEPIRITKVVDEDITMPRNDGTPGSALYPIPFQLSSRPSAEWAELFLQTWDHPPRFTTMHRPGIARVVGDRIILDGTTIEEVEKYHQETLVLAIQRANELFAEHEKARLARLEKERQELQKHKDTLREVSSRLKFDE